MSAEGTRDEGVVDELRALYREVDARYASTQCESTTECCRFGRTGREPYVTELELVLIRKAIARRGGAKALARTSSRSKAGKAQLDEVASRAKLPLVHDERRCGLLTREGRCSIYAERPFGCRTFFCDRASSLDPVSHREMLDFVARLKDLAQALGPQAHQGRPLSRILAAIEAGQPA